MLLAVLVDVADVDRRAVEVEHREAEQGPALETLFKSIAVFVEGRRRVRIALGVGHVDGYAAMADAAGGFDALVGAIEDAPVLVAPEPTPHPAGGEHGIDLLGEQAVAAVIGAKDLMMGEKHALAGACGERLQRPLGLVALQTAILPGGVQTKQCPVIVLEAEVAFPLLALEPRVLEGVAVEGVAAGVHVVVAVEVPRGDAILFARTHGPVLKEAVAVLILPARVIDVAEVDGVLFTPGGEPLVQYLAHFLRDLAGAGDSRAPVAHDGEASPVAEAHRRSGLVREGEAATEFADAHGDQGAHPTDIGDRKLVEDPPAVEVAPRE